MTHVSWYMPGLLTRGFLWSRWREKFPTVMNVGIANPRWRGKCSRHFRRMCNPQLLETVDQHELGKMLIVVLLNSFGGNVKNIILKLIFVLNFDLVKGGWIPRCSDKDPFEYWMTSLMIIQGTGCSAYMALTISQGIFWFQLPRVDFQFSYEYPCVI